MSLHTHPKQPRTVSANPESLNDVWFYEDERGFDVYVDVRDDEGVRLRHINFRIPWRDIEGAVSRRAVESDGQR